jgi:hypothetical protein
LCLVVIRIWFVVVIIDFVKVLIDFVKWCTILFQTLLGLVFVAAI